MVRAANAITIAPGNGVTGTFKSIDLSGRNEIEVRITPTQACNVTINGSTSISARSVQFSVVGGNNRIPESGATKKFVIPETHRRSGIFLRIKLTFDGVPGTGARTTFHEINAVTTSDVTVTPTITTINHTTNASDYDLYVSNNQEYKNMTSFIPMYYSETPIQTFQTLKKYTYDVMNNSDDYEVWSYGQNQSSRLLTDYVQDVYKIRLYFPDMTTNYAETTTPTPTLSPTPPTRVTDKYGNDGFAYQFDGSGNQWINYGNLSGFYPTADGQLPLQTMSFWYYDDATGPANATMFGNVNAMDVRNDRLVIRQPSGQGSFSENELTFPRATNSWQHLTVVLRRSGQVAVIRNGARIAGKRFGRSNSGTTQQNRSADWIAGKEAGTNDHNFKGAMSDLIFTDTGSFANAMSKFLLINQESLFNQLYPYRQNFGYFEFEPLYNNVRMPTFSKITPVYFINNNYVTSDATNYKLRDVISNSLATYPKPHPTTRNLK